MTPEQAQEILEGLSVISGDVSAIHHVNSYLECLESVLIANVHATYILTGVVAGVGVVLAVLMFFR